MVTYHLIFEDTKKYEKSKRSYGILAVGDNRRIRLIRDITDDKDRLSRFIHDLNAFSLDLVQLDEAVEDFLCNI